MAVLTMIILIEKLFASNTAVKHSNRTISMQKTLENLMYCLGKVD